MKSAKTVAVANLSADSKEFERQLNVFRIEAERAAQFFYALLSIHATAGKDRSVFKLLNTSALFWNTNLAALQEATFITLGRIFDDTSNHNIHRLISYAHQKGIFSKQALGQRKIESIGGKNPTGAQPHWLGSYLRESYEPTDTDFRRLKAHVKKYRRLYDDKARDIRRKHFAHNELADKDKVDALFSKTKSRDIQNLIVFLIRFHECLLQAFINGRKPVLRSQKYSVRRMMRGKLLARHLPSVQERITIEVRDFLKSCAHLRDAQPRHLSPSP